MRLVGRFLGGVAGLLVVAAVVFLVARKGAQRHGFNEPNDDASSATRFDARAPFTTTLQDERDIDWFVSSLKENASVRARILPSSLEDALVAETFDAANTPVESATGPGEVKVRVRQKSRLGHYPAEYSVGLEYLSTSDVAYLGYAASEEDLRWLLRVAWRAKGAPIPPGPIEAVAPGFRKVTEARGVPRSTPIAIHPTAGRVSIVVAEGLREKTIALLAGDGPCPPLDVSYVRHLRFQDLQLGEPSMIERYRDLSARTPGDPLALALWARVALRDDLPPILGKIEALKPGFWRDLALVQGRKQLGQANTSDHRVDDLVRSARGTQRAWALLSAAERAQRLGQDGDARRLVRQAEGLASPGDAALMFRLALVWQLIGDLDESDRLWLGAASESPASPTYQNVVSAIWSRKDRPDLVATHMEILVGLMPASPEYQLQLARAYTRLGLSETARRILAPLKGNERLRESVEELLKALGEG